MKTLLEYREKMKLFLGIYDIYIFPVLKFALALIVFLVINANVGFMSRLTNPGIALVLALICSFNPYCPIPCPIFALLCRRSFSVTAPCHNTTLPIN